MKKFFILMSCCWLAGCISMLPPTKELSELDTPESIKHNSKQYNLQIHNDLGTVGRYVYFEEKENENNWKSAIELLLDRRNTEELNLAERMALRERVYKNTGVEHFNLYEKDDALYAFVIFAPSSQNNNWQVSVAKGVNVENCGFVQYQYSLKIPKTKKMINMGKIKLIGYLKKYFIDKELQKMTTTEWQWHCKKKDNIQ